MGFNFLSSHLQIVAWNKHSSALQLNTTNLLNILKSVEEKAENVPLLTKLPTGIITVLGRNNDGLKQFWMNLLLHYYQVNGLGWLAEAAAAEDDKQDSSSGTGGMYLWPKPFVTKRDLVASASDGGENSETMLVWIVYVEMGEGDSSNSAVELLGALMSSRVIEIVKENEMPLLIQLAEFYKTYPGGLHSFSPSFSCIIRKNINGKLDSGPLKFVAKINKREEAENTVLCGSTLLGKLPDTFRIVIAKVSGTHINHSLESMEAALLKIADVITDVKGLSPKPLINISQPSTFHNFGNFVEAWVANVNEYLGKYKLTKGMCVKQVERQGTSKHSKCNVACSSFNTSANPKIENLQTQKCMKHMNVQTEPTPEQHCKTCSCNSKDVHKSIPETAQHALGKIIPSSSMLQTKPEPMDVDIENNEIPVEDEREYPHRHQVKRNIFLAMEDPLLFSQQSVQLSPHTNFYTRPISNTVSFHEALLGDLKEWIDKEMSVENIEEMAHVCQTTNAKYASALRGGNLGNVYSADVYKSYQDAVHKVVQKVQQFCTGIIYKFDNLVCFAEKREKQQLEKFFESEYENLMGDNNSGTNKLSNFQNEVVFAVCSKLKNIFRIENDKILEYEKKLASEINTRLVEFYREKMQLYVLIDSNYWDESKLCRFHDKLMKHCIYVLRQSMEYIPKVNSIIRIKAEMLERDLNIEFENIKEQQMTRRMKEIKPTALTSYQYQQPKTGSGHEMERHTLIFYFGEKMTYVTIAHSVKKGITDCTVQLELSLSKVVEESTTTAYYPFSDNLEQAFSDMIQWLKGESIAKIGWLEHPDNNLIFAIVPDWLTGELWSSFEKAMKNALKNARCEIVAKSEIASVNLFDSFRRTANANTFCFRGGKKRLVLVISESANHLHFSCFEMDNQDCTISSKNPVKLVAAAAGNFEEKVKDQQGSIIWWMRIKNQATKFFNLNSKDKQQFKEKVVEATQILWNTVMGQLGSRGMFFKKEVLLLSSSSAWREACQNYLKESQPSVNIRSWKIDENVQHFGLVISAVNLLVPLVCNGDLVADLMVDTTVGTGEDATNQVDANAGNTSSSRTWIQSNSSLQQPPCENDLGYKSYVENLQQQLENVAVATDVETHHASCSRSQQDGHSILQRKNQLLERCRKMREQIENKSVTFWPDFLKENTLQAIVKAENVAKEASTQGYELFEEEKHLDELVKVYEFKLS